MEIILILLFVVLAIGLVDCFVTPVNWEYVKPFIPVYNINKLEKLDWTLFGFAFLVVIIMYTVAIYSSVTMSLMWWCFPAVPIFTFLFFLGR